MSGERDSRNTMERAAVDGTLAPHRLGTCLLLVIYIGLVGAAWFGTAKVLCVQAGVMSDTGIELNQFLGGQPRFTAPTAGRVLDGSFQADLDEVAGDVFPRVQSLTQAARRIKAAAGELVLRPLPRPWCVVLPAGIGDFVTTREGDRVYPAPAILKPAVFPSVRATAADYNRLAERWPELSVTVFVAPAYGDLVANVGNWPPETKRLLRGGHVLEVFAAACSEQVAYDWAGRGRSVAEIDELYMKSDHHLSMRGSYEMYRTIHGMLTARGPWFGPLVPVREWRTVPGIEFRGANARQAGGYEGAVDPLIDVSLDLPAYQVVIHGNDRADRRDGRSAYLAGDVPEGRFANHYGEYFGWDKGLIEYSFPDAPSQRRLLVVSDSTDNSVELLLASHFRTAFFVDLREFENSLGHVFDVDDFISGHSISDVVFIGGPEDSIGMKVHN